MSNGNKVSRGADLRANDMQSPGQQREGIKELQSQSKKIEDKMDNLLSTFLEVRDMRNEITDEELLQKFDNNMDAIRQVMDTFLDFEFSEDPTAAAVGIAEQERRVTTVERLLSQMADCVDVDIIYESVPGTKNYDDEKIQGGDTMTFDFDDIDNLDEEFPNITEEELKLWVTSSTIEGIDELPDHMASVVQDAIRNIKERFDQIEPENESEITQFWKDVSKDIQEEGGVTGPYLEQAMNVIMDHVNELNQGSVQELASEVDAIFDFSEMDAYRGEEKTKKSQENVNRIEKYKKEIIETIEEIERVSGRMINRNQFVLDYVQLQNAPKIFEILKEHIIEQGEVQLKLDVDATKDIDLGDIQKTRDAADITFARMDEGKVDAGKLNDKTIEGGDEKFKQVTREVWRELAVHSRFFKNRDTGESGWGNKTDLDGQMALKLLREAGIKKQSVTYVPQGKYETKKINIDTGNQDGLVILEDGTVIIDHHGGESGNDNSSTKIVYDILTRLGLLEDKPEYKRAVDFVNGVDNFDYPDAENYFKNYFKNSWKTLQGLQYMLSGDKVLSFFKDKDDLSPTEPLSDSKMKKFGFTYRAKGHDQSQMESHRDRVYKAHSELKRLKESGFIVESDRYGKICVDVNQTLNNDAVRAFGCDTYIKWSKDSNSVFMSSLVGKPLDIKFMQGKKIRNTMWIKPRGDGKKLTMQLRDVLEKMTNNKLRPSEALQKALDNNGERTDRVELTQQEKKYLAIYIERARENIAFVEKIDLTNFKIDKKKEINNKKRELIKIVWKELEDDIQKGTRFTSGEASDIVLLIKDKL